jgi:hypothetical protein
VSDSKAAVHVHKFDKGVRTPDEVHRQLAFGPKARCVGCGSDKPAIRIKTLCPADELMRRRPDLVATLIALNKEGPYLPTIPTTYGPMVVVANTYACDTCKSAAERAAAHGPSWLIVEIDRMGLASSHKLVVQSAGVKE